MCRRTCERARVRIALVIALADRAERDGQALAAASMNSCAVIMRLVANGRQTDGVRVRVRRVQLRRVHTYIYTYMHTYIFTCIFISVHSFAECRWQIDNELINNHAIVAT